MTREFRHTTSANGADGWAELARVLRLLPSIEAVMACIVIVAFAVPIFTFSAPVDMNGINRAANQLSRKLIANQEKSAFLAAKMNPKLVYSGPA